MESISNAALILSARPDGGEIRIADKKRDAVWALDGQSVLWGGRVSKNELPIKDAEKSLKPLRPVSAHVDNGELVVEYSAGGYPVRYTYSLLEDGVEIRLSAPDSEDIEALSMPGAFLPEGQSYKLLLPIMQGMLWDGRGGSFAHLCRGGYQVGFSMRMYGIIGERGGLVAACDTAYDCLWLYEKDERGYRVQNIQEGSLGSMKYERIIRLYLADPGIVPIAKRYRKHVVDKGRFVSWEEKLARRPQLSRLFGTLMCFIGYCQDELDYPAEFQKLKDYGFDRVLAYPVGFSCFDPGPVMGGRPSISLSREQVERIKAMGYDVCPWTWIGEALESGDPKRGGMFRVGRDGERILSWQIDGYKWYKVCSHEMLGFERKQAAGTFSGMTWEHFDVLTCATLGECCAVDHASHPGRSLSRGEDIEWIRKTLLAGYGDGARIAVSSESFNDLFSGEYDLGSCKAWPQFGPWIFWPVPLTGLVYHDSMLHTWWEVHNYNAPQFSRSHEPNLFQYGGGNPDLQSAADALMGTPPDVFPFGTQYGWTGRGSETFAYRFRFEEPAVQYALQKALPVARLHRKIGMLEMVDFEILSEDGWVQRSAFSDGTEVIANFDIKMRNDVPGTDPIAGLSWKAK